MPNEYRRSKASTNIVVIFAADAAILVDIYSTFGLAIMIVE